MLWMNISMIQKMTFSLKQFSWKFISYIRYIEVKKLFQVRCTDG